MMPQVSNFIPSSLYDMDKHIKVAYRHQVMTKKGKLQIKICDNNSDTFIASLHNVLLVPDQCYRLFSEIVINNPGHTCLFHKGFCTLY